jgi:hypothetical protein
MGTRMGGVRRGVKRRRALVSVVLLLAAGAAAPLLLHTSRVHPGCTARSGEDSFPLDVEQAGNATLIAAVSAHMGLPDHAVTVALAAALQESKLRNLGYGDRDSLGLFQQRSSQGWGTPEQIRDPVHASRAFLEALAKIPGWETLRVTEAAQQVQRSAGPEAYAQWETESRVLASTITGQVPAGFSCTYPDQPASLGSAQLTQAVRAELGPAALGSASGAHGWIAASWLLARAGDYGLHSVSYAGMRWTRQAGVWKPAAGTSPGVSFTR